jgi:hypothetical protein
MTDERDDELLERLRRANPVPSGATAGRRLTADADALLADIVRAQVEPRPRPRRRRRRAVLIAIAIALLLLAALAAFWLRHEPDPKQPAAAACYPAADLRARPIIVGVAGDDPRVPCAEQWRLGKLGAGRPANFAVCVLANGVQAVFPGESGSTCDRLGLNPAGSGRRKEFAFSVDLGRRIHERCFDEAGARALVHDRLVGNGLSNWKVSVPRDRPFGRTYPCADVSIDIPARTVTIVATPDPFSSVPPG